MAIYYGHGKVRSRYRSAPIGSCHDLCKYGRKHECQEEERHLIFRKFMANSISKEDKKRSRKTLAVQPGESSSNPYKMKFKRGRVVEVCSANTAVPRKLRFRRGRVLGENPNGEFPKRIFRRRRDSGESNDPNSAASLTVMSKQHNSEAQGVMLKHQDARGKKDLQALFNHVIEETASKLVETRKSKVKALVGAFETVISLQETKPVSTG
ncbi:hypothetical protein AXF42_Ash021220 [Apostasia shenzhenica]|uniref:Calmodulin-binding domain-containing protein n=1 Tax=Apostasia shenzhenica TaxID=1088818 RepID=A0A2I0A573_9ASPA|nr:hypothetical protein AXF42_Ash021220 [Apostasia shenzhenica]